jgi:glucose-1-phosphate thymidylyltransferase
VASHYLIEKMVAGGAERIFMILRRGKWDIPEYYGSGREFGTSLAYLMMGKPYGPPYTLDEAYPFIQGATVFMGFPDILFDPDTAFAKALQRLDDSGADLVLGLFKANDVRVSDMIQCDRAGRVKRLVIKPRSTALRMGWVFAVWKPEFTEFMHKFLKVPRTSTEKTGSALPVELSVGHVIQEGIRAGLRMESVTFRGAKYLDIGTPDALVKVISGRRAANTTPSSGRN